MTRPHGLICCVIVVAFATIVIAKDAPKEGARPDAHRFWPPAMGIAEALDGETLRVTEFFEYDAAQVGEDVKTSLGDVEASQKILLDEIVAQRVDGTLVAPADVVKAFKKSGPIILSSKIPPDRTFLPLFKPDAIILQWPIQP
jgi:ABC-type sugar transport system substrate-binding protein